MVPGGEGELLGALELVGFASVEWWAPCSLGRLAHFEGRTSECQLLLVMLEQLLSVRTEAFAVVQQASVGRQRELDPRCCRQCRAGQAYGSGPISFPGFKSQGNTTAQEVAVQELAGAVATRWKCSEIVVLVFPSFFVIVVSVVVAVAVVSVYYQRVAFSRLRLFWRRRRFTKFKLQKSTNKVPLLKNLCRR